MPLPYVRSLFASSKPACDAPGMKADWSPTARIVPMTLPSLLVISTQRVARWVSNVRASTSTSRNVNIRSFTRAALREHERPSGCPHSLYALGEQRRPTASRSIYSGVSHSTSTRTDQAAPSLPVCALREHRGFTRSSKVKPFIFRIGSPQAPNVPHDPEPYC